MPAGSAEFDVVMIGHFAKDKIVYQGKEEISSGGAVYYGGMALARLGWRVAVVTRLRRDDFSRLDEMRQQGIRVFARAASATSGIENTYPTPDMDRRTCKPLGFAGPFSVADIPQVKASVWVVAPIIAGEVDLPFIKALAGRGTLALDIQGFVRVPVGEDLVFRPWPQMAEGLALIDVLKVDSAEAEALTGLTDMRVAVARLAGRGPKEVVLTHAGGVLVYAAGQCHEAPFVPREIKGRTGRGDTTFATYLAKRLSAPPAEACRFAAAVASLKMERPGPFRGTLAEVEAVLRTLPSG